jgi:hypothetical protein
VKCTVNGGVTLEGGKFVMVAVGEEPTSPLTTVPAPVEPVTPEFPNAENCRKTFMGGAVCANAGEPTRKSAIAMIARQRDFCFTFNLRFKVEPAV